MSRITKEDLLEKVEVSKRNLLELSDKALQIADELETIHIELSTTRDGTHEH
jgi:CRISPR/Cas system CSM-associated protein Csm2 small subunit